MPQKDYYAKKFYYNTILQICVSVLWTDKDGLYLFRTNICDV